MQPGKLNRNFALGVALAALLLAGPASATLFQNIARDMARNRALHILRHYPDLLNEVVQLQQQMMQQMQMQQMQQQQGMQQQQQQQLPNGMTQPLNNLNGGNTMVASRPGLPATSEGQLEATRRGRPLTSQYGIIV